MQDDSPSDSFRCRSFFGYLLNGLPRFNSLDDILKDFENMYS